MSLNMSPTHAATVELADITNPHHLRTGSLDIPSTPDFLTVNQRWEPDLLTIPPSSAGTMGAASTPGSSHDATSVLSGHGEMHKTPMPSMEDYLFNQFVRSCKVVEEETRYLEIFNYEGPQPNYKEEHKLPPDEFHNFFNQTGVFSPPKLKKDAKFLHGLRLVIQKNATHPLTFASQHISLSHDHYAAMVKGLKLSYRAIESGSAVGPFFWSAYDQDDSDPHLHIIYRKSDVRKKAATRGWELTLSYAFRTRMTTGYLKGTKSANLDLVIQHLMACSNYVGHPMLLPLIILSLDMDGEDEKRHRMSRETLRKLENAISGRDEIELSESYYLTKDGSVDLDAIQGELVECHTKVLWKRPKAYKEIIREMEKGMDRFAEINADWKQKHQTLSRQNKRFCATLLVSSSDSSSVNSREPVDGRDVESGRDSDDAARESQRRRHFKNRIRYNEASLGREMRILHRIMLSRLEFYTCKLTGMENYAHTTIERLNLQREILDSLNARTSSKLSLNMAGEQKRISHASKRDSTAMKALSLMGALFLPATFISSVFSMTFFDWQIGDNSPPGEHRTVAPELWIYFVVTLPVTITILVGWWLWDHKRENQFRLEDKNIDKEIHDMEKECIKSMRQRNLSRYETWGTKKRETFMTF